MVEQRAAQEETLLATSYAMATSVDDQRCAGSYTVVDVAGDLVAMLRSDDRPHIHLCAHTIADAQGAHHRRELCDQRISRRIAHDDGDGDRHATLARRAVAGTDQCIGGLFKIGIWHHDHVVLGAAQCLHALAAGGAARIDVFGNRRGANETHGAHLRMIQQRIHGHLVTLHHVEHTIR